MPRRSSRSGVRQPTTCVGFAPLGVLRAPAIDASASARRRAIVRDDSWALMCER